MKKLLLYTFVFFISFSYAQKKELRSADKLYSSGDYSSALDMLDSSKDLFDSSDDKLKAQVMLLYGKIHTSMETFDLAVKSFEMSNNLGTSDQVLNPEINKLETSIITSAIGDNENENFSWHVALSDPIPEDNWNGDTGFIHQVLFDNYLKNHPAPEDCEYYLCGPPMMNKAVIDMLLDLGVEKENIALDDFGG